MSQRVEGQVPTRVLGAFIFENKYNPSCVLVSTLECDELGVNHECERSILGGVFLFFYFF